MLLGSPVWALSPTVHMLYLPYKYPNKYKIDSLMSMDVGAFSVCYLFWLVFYRLLFRGFIPAQFGQSEGLHFIWKFNVRICWRHFVADMELFSTCLIKKWSTWFNMTPSSCKCMTTFHLRSYAMTMLIVQSSICCVTWRWMIALYAQWFCLKVLVAHPALSKAMWLKFLIIWRFARLWALCDGIEVVENMQRCVCNLASALQPGLKSRTLLCEAKATTTASQASGGGGLLASLSMRN